MNKNNIVLSIVTIVAALTLGFAAYPYQDAAALSTTLNCAPECFDEVSEHIKAAENKLEVADLPGAQAEIAIVKALIDQLELTTSVPNPTEEE